MLFLLFLDLLSPVAVSTNPYDESLSTLSSREPYEDFDLSTRDAIPETAPYFPNRFYIREAEPGASPGAEAYPEADFDALLGLDEL